MPFELVNHTGNRNHLHNFIQNNMHTFSTITKSSVDIVV